MNKLRKYVTLVLITLYEVCGLQNTIKAYLVIIGIKFVKNNSKKSIQSPENTSIILRCFLGFATQNKPVKQAVKWSS